MSNSAYDLANMQNYQMIQAMLNRNGMFYGAQPSVNSTMGGTYMPSYGTMQPLGSATMFGQLQQAVSSISPTAGALMPMAMNALGGFIPQVGQLNTFLNSTMPFGGGDFGAFQYHMLNSRLGKSVPSALPLPTEFANNRAIDQFNNQLLQQELFMGRSVPQGAPLAGALANLNTQIGGENSGYGIGIQLANIRTLGNNQRFSSMYDLYEGLSGVDRNDSRVDALIAAAQSGNAAEADRLLNANNGALRAVADKIITNASGASGMAGQVVPAAKALVKSLGLQESDPMAQGVMTGLVEAFSGIFGVDNDPGQVSAAAIQSMSMMGGVGMSMVATANGRPMLAADRVGASLMAEFEDAGSKLTSLKKLGTGGASQLMQQLSESGMLTSGGVDVFGNLTIEDVTRMTKAVERQLEGFSEIVRAGKRMGLTMQELTSGLQTAYRGNLVGAMEEKASNIAREMRAGGFTGSEADLRVEAMRKAGTDIASQYETTVAMGRFAGLDSKSTAAMISTVSELGMSLGVSGEGAIAMARNALGVMADTKGTGKSMSREQAIAQQMDIVTQARNSSTGKAMARLIGAKSKGLIDDPTSAAEAEGLIARFREGQATQVDVEAVDALLRRNGAETFTGNRGVEIGLSTAEFHDAAQSAQILGKGGVQRIYSRLDKLGLNTDSLVGNISAMSSADVDKLAKDLGVSTESLKGMSKAGILHALSGQGSYQDIEDSLVAMGYSVDEAKKASTIIGDLPGRFGTKGGDPRVLLNDAEMLRSIGITGSQATAKATVAVTAGLNAEFAALIGDARSPVGSMLKAKREEKARELVLHGPYTDYDTAYASSDANLTTEELLSSLAGMPSDAATADILDRRLADATARSQSTSLSEGDREVAKREALQIESFKSNLASRVAGTGTPGTPGTPGTSGSDPLADLIQQVVTLLESIKNNLGIP